MSEIARISAEEEKRDFRVANVFHAGGRPISIPWFLRPRIRVRDQAANRFPIKFLSFMPRGRWPPSLAKHGPVGEKRNALMSKWFSEPDLDTSASPLRVDPLQHFKTHESFRNPRRCGRKKPGEYVAHAPGNRRRCPSATEIQ